MSGRTLTLGEFLSLALPEQEVEIGYVTLCEDGCGDIETIYLGQVITVPAQMKTRTIQSWELGGSETKKYPERILFLLEAPVHLR